MVVWSVISTPDVVSQPWQHTSVVTWDCQHPTEMWTASSCHHIRKWTLSGAWRQGEDCGWRLLSGQHRCDVHTRKQWRGSFWPPFLMTLLVARASVIGEWRQFNNISMLPWTRVFSRVFSTLSHNRVCRRCSTLKSKKEKKHKQTTTKNPKLTTTTTKHPNKQTKQSGRTIWINRSHQNSLSHTSQHYSWLHRHWGREKCCMNELRG